MQTHYQLPDMSCWQGRSDAKPKEYLFQLIQPLNLHNPLLVTSGYVLLGFACDAGIKRNQGRPGAKQGPQAIKAALAKMPVHHELLLYDAGQIICFDDDLEAAQTALADAVFLLLQQGLKPIILGGGHETAWGHYQGLAQYLGTTHLGIINFDAHFDLRDLLPNNKGSSGTPFRQIALARQQQQLNFSYYCLGVQANSNTQSLFATAKELCVEYVDAYTMNTQGAAPALALINKAIAQHDAIYLSICLDVFAAYLAPGVSAPQPLGLRVEPVLACLHQLAASKKIISLDIVELAPPYDIDQHTTKLAANLLMPLIE